MLNRRAILLGILCVLFVVAAFGQDSSDPNIITVTRKIDVAKLDENVQELNRNVKTLSDTLGKLNENVETLTKTVGSLEKTVTKLEERTGIMLNLQYIILAGIFGPLLYSIYQNKKNKTGGEATSVNKSETASTNLAQMSEGEIAPTPTASSRFPEGKELKEYLKSDSFTTTEKV